MKNGLIFSLLLAGCATHTQTVAKMPVRLDTKDIYHDLLVGQAVSSTVTKTATTSMPIYAHNTDSQRIVNKRWGFGFGGDEYKTISFAMVTGMVRVGIDLASRDATNSAPTSENIMVSVVDLTLNKQKSTSRLVLMPSLSLLLFQFSLVFFDKNYLTLRVGVYSGIGYDFHFDLSNTDFSVGGTHVTVPTDLKSKDGITSHSTVGLDIGFLHFLVAIIVFTDPRFEYGIGITW